MLKNIFQNTFLRRFAFLPTAGIVLFLLSFFITTENGDRTEAKFTEALNTHILKAEKSFAKIVADTAIINATLTGGSINKRLLDLDNDNRALFVYKDIPGFFPLIFWSSQAALPSQQIIESGEATGIARLPNGWYFFQRKKARDVVIVGLLLIKSEYAVTNDYLANNFAVDPERGKFFQVSTTPLQHSVITSSGKFLFSPRVLPNISQRSENSFPFWLRVAAMAFLLIFIHVAARNIVYIKGFAAGIIFLSATLILLRALSYLLPFSESLRRFELFDPAVYGSDVVLRSLGDLLINALLFFWLISFTRNNLKGREFARVVLSPVVKIISSAIGVFVILFVTYTGLSIIRSLIADSQISFDVINFFSLNIYSVIGFLVLCCIAIGYYYFCRIVLFFLKNVYPRFHFPFFLSVAVGGLILLSFRIGALSGLFELYVLLWLLVFLLLIKNDLTGFFSKGLIVSKMVFWLFFFSLSIAAVIVSENHDKELRNRQHYAELLSAKSDPINAIFLNTMLSDFNPYVLAQNFNKLTNESTSVVFRDSLVANNFSGFQNKYDTKVLVYDSLEQPLYNSDAFSFNEISSIYEVQAKTTPVAGLRYFESAYDKFSYISGQTVRSISNTLLGYVFIIVSPKSFESNALYPDIFSSGNSSSIENAANYAYAVYDKGKLVSNYNDYAFSAKYPEKYFAGRQFLLDTKNKYSELWYNAGSEKFVVIVKETRLTVELIALFSYLFCAFILLSALFWLMSLLVRTRFRLNAFKREFRFTIRQQVHGTVILFSAISFLIIGIATILFFISRYETNNREMLSRTIRIMKQDLAKSIDGDIIRNSIFAGKSASEQVLQTSAERLSEIHGPEVNIYSLTGDLKASSISLPYSKGIVSTKMDPQAYFSLRHRNEIQSFQHEHIGRLNFVSEYIPVTNANGEDIAYLNIPYFTSRAKLKEEISNFLVTIINLNAFIFLIAGMVALIITNRITRSFSFISDQMQKINLGRHNEAIEWARDDEIGALVKEYNSMLQKLDASAAALARTERENAWQEMAKQVAHEIKNPLTPMKLSMQFLQRSIQNDAPGIKELAAKVSATLVEQIDHLSNIAGEFSRFANIEKATPEVFNLNETLRSIKQLYAGDLTTEFTWRLGADPVTIRADRTHINRILTNLILNAIQSVPADRIARVNVEEILKDSGVTVTISDNGSGIPVDLQPKIFTPNFTTKSSGTGLGLAMCRRMAEQAGGTISYETSAAGTAFSITLPLVKS